MRKFYSLVLIAAGLLIGTNVRAQVAQIGTQTYNTLEAAFNAAQDDDVIELIDNAPVSSTINLGANGVARNLTLDFAGFAATKSTSANFINLYKGSLTLKDSNPNENSGLRHIWNPSAPAKKYTITVYGTYKKGINPRTAGESDLFAHLVVEASAKIVSDGIAIMLLPHRASASTENKTCMIYKDHWNETKAKFDDGDPRGVANGVRIDIYGKVHGALYAAQANGQLACPLDQYASYYNSVKADLYTGDQAQYAEMAIGDTAYAPYVHIHQGAAMTSADVAKSVAVYSSGYARWLIEAPCSGATGVYMKSGDITLNGATITSSYNGTAENELGKTIGVSGGGNAVVVESNGHYAGNCVLDIEGSTTISTNASNGTALLEAIAPNADGSKVEEITINGGTFSAENAIVVSEKTADENKVTVYQVNDVTGEVEVGGNTGVDAIAAIVADGKYPSVDGQGNLVINSGYKVTLNGSGLATFSAEKKVQLAGGLVAYAATELNGNNELVLEEMVGSVVPANTGVILVGTADASFILDESTESNGSFNYPNLLKPATEWAAQYVGNAYILHDNMLYLYTGEYFKNNKAFLYLGTVSGNAPQRIRMSFNQTTDVENVEVEAAKAEKFYENGQLFIRRGAEVFNAQGQLVK